MYGREGLLSGQPRSAHIALVTVDPMALCAGKGGPSSVRLRHPLFFQTATKDGDPVSWGSFQET